MASALPRMAAIAATMLLAAGCVSEEARVAEMERMLAAAGFRQEPADTAERQAELARLVPHALVERPSAGGYVYADPQVCRCLWVGDAASYRAYQQLAEERQREAEDTLERSVYEEELWHGPPPLPLLHR